MSVALEFDELDPVEAPGARCCLCGCQLGEGRRYVCTLCQARAEERLANARAQAPEHPHLRGGELRIPFRAPERYHWWREGGQPVEQTLLELQATCEVLWRYTYVPTTGRVRPNE